MNVYDAFIWMDDNHDLITNKSSKYNINFYDALNIGYEAAFCSFQLIIDKNLPLVTLQPIFNKFYDQLLLASGYVNREAKHV
jgi:hypothetical protein